GSAAMAAPSAPMSATETPNFQAVPSPIGSQSLICATGRPATGTCTWMLVWYCPFISKLPKSGARWFEVEWQLAQMAEEVSWKSTRPPLSAPAMDAKGQGEVYWPAPMGTGLADSSAGWARQAKTSWKKRCLRKARLP